MQEWFNICKSNNVKPYINRMKDKNHIIVSIAAEKAFDKKHSFMIKKKKNKPLNKLSMEATYLNTIKAIYEKPKANIIFNGEKLKTFPIKFRTKQRCPLLTFLYSIVLEVLARVIK